MRGQSTKSKRPRPTSVREIWELTGLSRLEFAQELGLAEPMVKVLFRGKRNVSADSIRKLYLAVGAKLDFSAAGRCTCVRDALTGAAYNEKSYSRWKDRVQGVSPARLEDIGAHELATLQVFFGAAYLENKFLVAQDELANAMFDILQKLDLKDTLDKAFTLMGAAVGTRPVFRRGWTYATDQYLDNCMRKRMKY